MFLTVTGDKGNRTLNVVRVCRLVEVFRLDVSIDGSGMITMYMKPAEDIVFYDELSISICREVIKDEE